MQPPLEERVWIYQVDTTARQVRFTARASGHTVALPLDPMLGLYAAVTRQFPDGTPPGGWFPEERLSMAEAIEYYTLGSAYAEFAETRKGSIAEGKLADLVLLSNDLFTIPPREILKTRPVLTIAGGRIVFEARANP